MEVDYIKALKDQFYKHREKSLHVFKGLKTDAQFCETLGIPTWWLRFDLGYPTATHRGKLKKLEKQGKVISFSNSKNNRFWWPVGFAEEINSKCKDK